MQAPSAEAISNRLVGINALRSVPLGVMFNVANHEKEWQIGEGNRRMSALF